MGGIEFPEDSPALPNGFGFAFGGGGEVQPFRHHDRESGLQACGYCAALQPSILDLVVPKTDVDERYARSALLGKRRKVGEKAALVGRLG